MELQQWENPHAHWSDSNPMFLLWVDQPTFTRVQEFAAQTHEGVMRTSMDLHDNAPRSRSSWYAFVFEDAPSAALLFRLMFEDCLRMGSVDQMGHHGYGVDFRVELQQAVWRV